jgi:hypothetical protein
MKNTALKNTSTLPTGSSAIKINIQGIQEPAIYQYFTRLNNSEFLATAELFAEQGCLNPPFDKQLQGRETIAQYLEKEAEGIRSYPEYGEIFTSDADHTQYQIQGKVEMNWFTVNVSWSIDLNAAKEIMTVDVKLLASLDDLLSFSHI